LEIRVTNLWPNRLIGDEQQPPDCKYSDRGFITQWPKWVSEDKPHATANGRYTFTTWKHYTKNSPLLESGLIGPVRLLGAIQRTVAQ
jgi:hypothetical protein